MELSSLDVTEAIGAEGATHPRVTLDGMKDKIASAHYFWAGAAVNGGIVAGLDLTKPHPLDLLTICILVKANGFTVIGKSAPASPENFDIEKGKTFAFEDAIRQLWPLEGYALRERLARGEHVSQQTTGYKGSPEADAAVDTLRAGSSALEVITGDPHHEAYMRQRAVEIAISAGPHIIRGAGTPADDIMAFAQQIVTFTSPLITVTGSGAGNVDKPAD